LLPFATALRINGRVCEWEFQRLKPLGHGEAFVVAEATTHKDRCVSLPACNTGPSTLQRKDMPQRLKPRESSDLDGTTALRFATADSLRHITQGRQNDARLFWMNF